MTDADHIHQVKRGKCVYVWAVGSEVNKITCVIFTPSGRSGVIANLWSDSVNWNGLGCHNHHHMHNMANIIPLTYQNAVACGDSVEALKQLNRKAYFNGMLFFHNIILPS